MKEISDVERIKLFILEQIPKARQLDVQNEDDLIETGLLDSLGILDVVSYLEEEFSISISDEELTPENFNCITNMAEYVRTKKSNMFIS